MPRLVKGQELRLTVTDKEMGRTVFSIPLIDYALLVKGFYNRDMDDQEYLDRQDVYDMVFFLDESDRWLDAYIYVNSWKVVLHNSALSVSYTHLDVYKRQDNNRPVGTI